MFYVGIDIAKNKHDAFIINCEGSAVGRSFSFQNSETGFKSFVNFLTQNEVSYENSIIGMESTGHYWFSLYCHLIELNFTVNVINPIQSDCFRKMQIRQTKTDSRDSYIIAQVMRFGQFSASDLAKEPFLELKQLSRYRLFLVDECSDIKRKIISLLDQVFPEYSKIFSDTFGSASKEVLLNCPTPEDMLNISSEKLIGILKTSSKGRFTESKSDGLKAAAKSSFGIKFAAKAFSLQIRQLILQINQIEEHISEIESEISKILSEIDTQITSITGIGDVLGAIILSEIGNISRFSEASKLVAFAGLDVSVKQSEEFSATHNKLSKRGSPYLRRAIWLAATVASFKDPALSVYYQSLKDRGKHHLVAVGAVARKICNIIFAVLRDNKPYKPNLV